MDTKAIMKKYPRLTAQMMCESLGYFTPSSAARAILAYIEGKPYYCEWYEHIVNCTLRNKREGANKSEEQVYLEVGKKILSSAITTRRYHKGYMAEYSYALELVRHAITEGQEPMLAGWF